MKRKKFGGKKQLQPGGATPRSITLTDEQWLFLERLGAGKKGGNRSRGVRILCDMAMHSHPEKLASALQEAIALIEQKDLEKLQQLLPVLEDFLEYIQVQCKSGDSVT